MSAITSHVLDAVLGQPARDMAVCLEKKLPDGWVTVGKEITDRDGRCRGLCSNGTHGIYRLTFSTGPYFAMQNRKSLYPEVSITFEVDGEHHYHIPLLLSDNSYTTYRGS